MELSRRSKGPEECGLVALGSRARTGEAARERLKGDRSVAALERLVAQLEVGANQGVWLRKRARSIGPRGRALPRLSARKSQDSCAPRRSLLARTRLVPGQPNLRHPGPLQLLRLGASSRTRISKVSEARSHEGQRAESAKAKNSHLGPLPSERK